MEDSLPFGSKPESARVYAVEKETGKELYSQAIEDGQASVERSFKLAAGKSRIQLFGEVTCEDGMRYRSFLGQSSEDYYDRYGNYGLRAHFYFTKGSAPDGYSLHALFPDGTMIGLPTTDH